MNKRFQVYLDERQRRALERLATRLKRSRADLVRMGIDRVLSELTPPEDDPAWDRIGLIDSTDTPGDLAERHDHYLELDYIERHES